MGKEATKVVRSEGPLSRQDVRTQGDSVDHTLKKLPSVFAAVVADDTQFQAVGKCHQVSQRFSARSACARVAGLVVSSKKLEIHHH